MSARPFSVGSITFGTDPTSPNSAMEVPDELAVPRRMLGTVHDIPQTDGSPARRVAQTFGVVYAAITYKARFSGPDMQKNIDQMDALHAQQVVVPFSVGATTYDVVVWEFTPTLVGATNDVVYEITLQPLVSRRTSSSTSTPDASAALDAGIAQLGATLTDPTVPTTDPITSNATIQTAYAQAAAVGPVANASAASLLTLATSLTLAVSAARAVVAQTRGQTLVTASLASYDRARSVASTLQNILTTIRTYTGQQQRTALPGAMNAYEFAAAHTGDVNNADAIMQVNGITDPFDLDPSTPLAIPNTVT